MAPGPRDKQSKLATYSDGARILATIGRLYIAERPLQFYTMVAAAVSFAAFLLALPIVVEFFKTGLVPRLPTAVLCAALAISALLSLTCGLILDNVVRCRAGDKAPCLSSDPARPAKAGIVRGAQREIFLFAGAGIVGFLIDAGVFHLLVAWLGLYSRESGHSSAPPARHGG